MNQENTFFSFRKRNSWWVIIIAMIVLWIFPAACDKEEPMEEMMEMEEPPIEIPKIDQSMPNGGCDTLTPTYLDSAGMIHIEVESADYDATSWSYEQEVGDYSGAGYLVWRGNTLYNEPGIGLLTFRVRIDTPGTYRFIWRSRIMMGNSQSDYNDTWLRLPDADHFYGRKANGHTVYPKGSQQAPLADVPNENTVPNGSGRSGWFKVYMNTTGRWHWKACTSDHDPHSIYAVYNQPGVYTIQLSGRSPNHGLDRMTLYLDRKYMQAAATNLGIPVSAGVCEE